MRKSNGQDLNNPRESREGAVIVPRESGASARSSVDQAARVGLSTSGKTVKSQSPTKGQGTR